MAQQYLLINDIKVKVLSDDGYTMQLATTHTEDSGRNQYLKATVTPIGSVASYGLKWTDLTAEEMSQILKQVLNKPQFKVILSTGFNFAPKKSYFLNFSSRLSSERERLLQTTAPTGKAALPAPSVNPFPESMIS